MLSIFFSEKGIIRGPSQGFDGVKGEATAARIKLWNKNSVECNWKTWEVNWIRYTIITKSVTYEDSCYDEKFIAPFGMKESIKKRKKDVRGKSSLPEAAKLALALPENYNVKDIKEFYVLLCKKCHFHKHGYMM